MSGPRFDLKGDVRQAIRRRVREARTPVVIYRRGRRPEDGYARANLATVGDYLTMASWPPDYTRARLIDDPADVAAMEEARKRVTDALEAEHELFARLWPRGRKITAVEADAAKVRE